MNEPIKLQERHFYDAARVLHEAFKVNPLWQYLVPDPDQRDNEMRALWEMFVKFGMRYGQCFVSSEKVEGVSIWVPSENAKMTLWKQIRSGGLKVLRNLGLGFLKRSNIADKAIIAEHEKYAPPKHWYLQQLAVDPKEQGKGYASLLLRDFFAKNDEAQIPYYLETGLTGNVEMYEHLGFELLETKIIPQTNVKMWFMIRKDFIDSQST